jgi:uncharacterized membrane protein
MYENLKNILQDKEMVFVMRFGLEQGGNFQNGAQFERGLHMGGFPPLMGWVGLLLLILFIALSIRIILNISRDRIGYGNPGYLRHIRETEEESEQITEMKNSWKPSKPDEATEILRKRYATGEINKEEFEEKAQILKG